MTYAYMHLENANRKTNKNATTQIQPISKLLHAHSSLTFHPHINTSWVRGVISSGTQSGAWNKSIEKLNTESFAFQVFHCEHACIFITCMKKK